jgi:hypothetical protein
MDGDPRSLESEWQDLTRAAEEWDQDGRSGQSWVPPVFTALVAATDGTPLRDLIPFTSINRLCFTRDPQWWKSTNQEAVLPVCIELRPGVGYVVRGHPYHDSGDDFGYEYTDDPRRAVQAAIGRLD